MSILRSTLLVTRSIATRHRAKTLASVTVSLVASGLSVAALFARARFVAQAYDVALSIAGMSVGDAILWLFLGHPSGLIAEWAVVWVGILACSLSDPCGERAHVYVLTGSRGRCWAAYCFASCIWSLVPLITLVASVVAIVLLLGGSPALAPSSIEHLSLGSIASGTNGGDIVLFLACVFVGSVALSLLQLAISTCVHAPVAFATTSALVLGSAFAPTLPLPGSFLMASRIAPFASAADLLRTSSWHPSLGIAFFLVVGAASALVGWLRFSQLDLIERTRR